MLKFTTAGVVAAPRAVQVRVGAGGPAGPSAGAPQPTRTMTAAEGAAAVRHFTVGQRGPRAAPCDEVVLTTLVDGAAGWDELVVSARAWGVHRLVVHAAGPTRLDAEVDEVVAVVRDEEDLPRLRGWRAGARVAVVPLTAAALAGPAGLRAVELAVAEGVERVVLSWPFPPGPPPAAPAVVAAWLDDAARALGPVPWSVKGLPGCLAGAWAQRRSRTRNRWYVDADHPPSAALLVVPDLLRFVRPDACRWCALDPVCDGVPATWWEQGVVADVAPVT